MGKIEKIVSAVIVIIYLYLFLVDIPINLFTNFLELFLDVFALVALLFFAILLIWRSDEFSSYLVSDAHGGILGALRNGSPKQTIPGIFGKIVGWSILIFPLVIFLLIHYLF